MSHNDDKSRVWRHRARYFILALVVILAGAGAFLAGHGYGLRHTPAPPTALNVDPAAQAAFFASFSAVRQPEARAVFPAFEYLDAHGKRQTLRVEKGRMVLLNVWATWCPPCLVELPDLETLSTQSPDNIDVLAVSVDSQMDQGALLDFLKKRGIWAGAANLDAQSIIMRNAPVRGLPTSFLLAEGGEILYIFEGAAPWASPEAIAFFRSLPTRY